MALFTPAHYFLFGLSALVLASFFLGLVFLVIREQCKGTEARKQKWKNLLQRRRKAISGRPRNPATEFSEESTTEEWQISSTSSRNTDTKSSEIS